VLLVAREDLRVGLAMGAFCALALFVAGRLRDRAVPQTTEERAVWARSGSAIVADGSATSHPTSGCHAEKRMAARRRIRRRIAT
jgi:hypothetical protein